MSRIELASVGEPPVPILDFVEGKRPKQGYPCVAAVAIALAVCLSCAALAVSLVALDRQSDLQRQIDTLQRSTASASASAGQTQLNFSDVWSRFAAIEKLQTNSTTRVDVIEARVANLTSEAASATSRGLYQDGVNRQQTLQNAQFALYLDALFAQNSSWSERFAAMSRSINDTGSRIADVAQLISDTNQNLAVERLRIGSLNDSLTGTGMAVTQLQTNTSALQSALIDAFSFLSNQSLELDRVRNTAASLVPSSSGYACSKEGSSPLCLRWIRTPRTLTLLSGPVLVAPGPGPQESNIGWTFHLADFADSNQSIPVTVGYRRQDFCTFSVSVTSTNTTSSTRFAPYLATDNYPANDFSLNLVLLRYQDSPPWYGNLTVSIFAICPVKECTDPANWNSPQCSLFTG